MDIYTHKIKKSWPKAYTLHQIISYEYNIKINILAAKSTLKMFKVIQPQSFIQLKPLNGNTLV